MPITDNTFTAAEVQAALAANPNLFAEIQNGVKPLGHHAFLKDEYDTFVNNERTRIAGEERSTIYKSIDDDVLKTSGVAKLNGDEKTYEYVKRVLGDGSTKLTALQAKIADLEKKIADGNTDQSVKDQLEAAKQKLDKYDKEDIPSFQAQLFAKDVELEFALAMQKLKIKADLPEVLLTPALNMAREELIKSAKRGADGKIYFVDAEGKALLNGVNNASVVDILSTRLKDILDTTQQQPGSGTKPPAAGGTGSGAATGVKDSDGNDIVVPESIKTQIELDSFLRKKGLLDTSKEFTELMKTHGAKLPLR